jgi:hypothetical protein
VIEMTETKWRLSASGKNILNTTLSLFFEVFGISLIVLFVLMILQRDDGSMNRQDGDRALFCIFRYGMAYPRRRAVLISAVFPPP